MMPRADKVDSGTLVRNLRAKSDNRRMQLRLVHTVHHAQASFFRISLVPGGAKEVEASLMRKVIILFCGVGVMPEIRMFQTRCNGDGYGFIPA